MNPNRQSDRSDNLTGGLKLKITRIAYILLPILHGNAIQSLFQRVSRNSIKKIPAHDHEFEIGGSSDLI